MTRYEQLKKEYQAELSVYKITHEDFSHWLVDIKIKELEAAAADPE